MHAEFLEGPRKSGAFSYFTSDCPIDSQSQSLAPSEEVWTQSNFCSATNRQSDAPFPLALAKISVHHIASPNIWITKMYKLLSSIPLIAALAACDTQEQTLAASTLAGAVLGATVSGGDDKTKGAILGGAAGLAAGSLISRDQSGQCIYQRQDGTRYAAACP
jgi:hypothetical protein